MTDAETIETLRQAWRIHAQAERELRRLRKYTNETPGMRSDRARWERQRNEAGAILRRILGGESP